MGILLTSILPGAGPQGAAGTNLDITITAGETLTIRDCVYLAGPWDVGKTSGLFYKCDSATDRSSSLAGMIGFATTAITTGTTGTIRIAGMLSGFSGMLSGKAQFVGTSGAIADTVSGNSRLVGFATSTTELLINSAGTQTAVGAGGIKGFTFGGYDGSNFIITCNKLTFSTDVMATATTANLTTATYVPQGLSQGSTKGYIAGGSTGAYILVVTAYKTTFSSETTALMATANLSVARNSISSVSERSTKGYFLGGAGGGGSTAVSDKTTFSTDSTAAQTTANLSSARNGSAGVSEGASKGYITGGQTGVSVCVATADKIVFSTDITAAATTANLSQARLIGGNGISGGGAKGYIAGGDTTNNNTVTVITADKITFSTDTTVAQTSANLTQARSFANSMSEGITKGYFCGGYTNNVATASAVTDKTVFATDVTAAQTTANFGTGTYGAASFSDVGL